MTFVPAILFTASTCAFLFGYALFRRRRRGLGVIPSASRRAATTLVSQELMDYAYWLIAPVERALASSGASPNLLTLAGLGLSVAAGIAAGSDGFGVAGILYLASGVLDILDGRVARRSGRSTPAGALLDSVCDRWGEFAVLGGLAFATRHDPLALAAVLLATAGSQMVSYTRARAEGLGVSLAVGLMQRSERIVVVGLGLLAAGSASSLGPLVPMQVLTPTLLLVGGMSVATAIRRLSVGSEALGAPRAEPEPKRRISKGIS